MPASPASSTVAGLPCSVRSRAPTRRPSSSTRPTNLEPNPHGHKYELGPPQNALHPTPHHLYRHRTRHPSHQHPVAISASALAPLVAMHRMAATVALYA